MKKTLLLSILFLMMAITAWSGGIGTWKSYLAYGDISEIQSTGKIIYVLSSKGLFSYNTSDQSIQTYDKMNALSDCNISHIAYCKAAKRLVIIYQNQNIDLLEENGDVVNISAYYNKSMTADKTINEVKIIGKYAYLSTNFGILKINVANAEITDTYNLGRKILSTVTHGDQIFAVTENDGIISAKTSTNLLDKSNWSIISNKNLMSLYELNGQMIGISDDAVFRWKNTEWEKIYDYPTISSTLADDKLILLRPEVVWILDSNLQRTVVPHYSHQLKAMIYDKANNCYWSNQNDDKLYSFTLEGENIIPSLTDINPDGPKYNYFGFLKYVNNTLYSCGGGFNSPAELFRPAIVQTFANDEWTLFEGDTEADYLFQDFACLDLDPQNPTHIFAGGRTGLYEYNNGRMVKYHNVDNSLLEYSTADCTKNYILTLGVKFDKQGNLWCLNSLAESASILKLSTDGKWESHHKKILVDDNNRSLANLRGLTMDSRGYLWFVNNHWALPSFYCFDPSSDAINYFSNFVNEDGTTITTTGVRCIEEDKEGNMWIGTNVGPLMLLAKDISESNAVLQQVKVPRNDGTNFADYLLSGVDITCIAIDGGGRKWFGTNGNGVYLISEDNMEQVQHFTNSNSALLSNNIEAITINDKTGEVFFGTDNGLCSYMSDASATNENMTSDNVYAYPNPVEPDYTGLITIVGLSYNADVKIVTANGALVASGTSNGGSFTWDGCDLNGKRVASGVYMVETATSEGKKGTVCKIAIVR